MTFPPCNGALAHGPVYRRVIVVRDFIRKLRLRLRMMWWIGTCWPCSLRCEVCTSKTWTGLDLLALLPSARPFIDLVCTSKTWIGLDLLALLPSARCFNDLWSNFLCLNSEQLNLNNDHDGEATGNIVEENVIHVQQEL